jgi:hypothetical protein
MNNKNSGETENKKVKIEVLPSQNRSTESSNCENSINEKENTENKKAREKVLAEERKQFVNQWIESVNILAENNSFTDLEEESNPSENRIRTRSQAGGKFIELTVEKRIRKVKEVRMANEKPEVILNLTEALHLIPKYSGETDIHPFLSTCDTIIGMVAEAQVPLLIKMITTTKLTGRAFNVTRYRETGNWDIIRQELLNSFEPPYASANLQIELNLIKMGHNETISEYTTRVEGIFQKLCNANSLNKTASDAKAIRENIKEQALISYINGLTDQLKFEVKTKNPDTLEKAMIIAALAEKDIKTYNEAQEFYNKTQNNNNYNRNNNNSDNNNFNRNFQNNGNFKNNNFNRNDNNNYNNNNTNRGNFLRNNNNDNRNNSQPNNNYNRRNNFSRTNNSYNYDTNNIKCGICSRIGHYASQCRSGQMQQNTNNRSYNNNNQAPNNFTRPATNYNNNNNRALSCTYCGRVGHEISTCYKKLLDERKNNGINQSSGNAQGTQMTHGTSGIHQIFSVNPNEIATTSYQN